MSAERLEIGRVFDEIIEGYTDIMDSMVPHYRTLLKAMFDGLESDADIQSVLDMGCGNGNATAIAMAAFPAARFHLVDASARMIEECRERFKSRSARYSQTPFQELRLEQEHYDLVLASFSFHHLDADEKAQLFRTIYAALKPNGYFSCADLMIDKDSAEHPAFIESWKEFVFANGQTIEDWEWLTDHYERYDRPTSFARQCTDLEKAGFADVRITWQHKNWKAILVRK